MIANKRKPKNPFLRLTKLPTYKPAADPKAKPATNQKSRPMSNYRQPYGDGRPEMHKKIMESYRCMIYNSCDKTL
jgi:hypothetical protein